ncbi:MAG TPA: hypothetical protein VH307_29930 [Streptosporangiaceae bacterium]|nr:hypothetical protein [Streptosporangiaceae bacterium]
MSVRRLPLRLPVFTAAMVAITAFAVPASAGRSHPVPGAPGSGRGALGSAAPAGEPHGCDPIGTGNCLIPFPDDYYAVSDPASLTGERIAFSAGMMPASASGVHIDPTTWDRSDGFSPGGPILTVLPGVDLTASHVAPITDIGASLSADAPIVLLDTRTRRRIPYWAELDATNPDPATRALLIHPAYRLSDQTTYIVALRDLASGTGQLLTPPPGFQAMLNREPPTTQPLRQRWLELRPVLRYLARSGVPAHGLDQAWEFTTASTRSLTGQALHMRDQAFAALRGRAPASVVTKVTDYTPGQNAEIARVVDGYVEVPSYLNERGGPPGSMLHYASAEPGMYAAPEQVPGNIQQAAFECVIPRGAMAAPARNVLLFGHGLLQDQTIVSSTPIEVAAAEHDAVVCGADWLGLSAQDLGTLISLSKNLSEFSTVPDRMQQAYLDFLFLGRAMIRPGGLAALPAFRDQAGQPVIAPRPHLAYAGYSLGGIEGGALAALAQDYSRAALYVPGSEFSLMIERSADFTAFGQLIAQTYPDRLGIQVGIALTQMLWDRGEPDGYIDHVLRDPLPGTPVKRLLVQEVFGDHQVPNIATETEARTLGLPAYAPELQPGRSADVVPFWGIRPIRQFPYAGSALFVWDSGSPPVPLSNIPPTAGHDPHNDLATTPAPQELGTDFVFAGLLPDACGGTPCYALPGG